MNFDPIGYAIRRLDHIEQRTGAVEQRQARQERMTEDHAARLRILETWRTSWNRISSKWPLLVAGAAAIAANIDPATIATAIVTVGKIVLATI